jgi:hypothetical protein
VNTTAWVSLCSSLPIAQPFLLHHDITYSGYIRICTGNDYIIVLFRFLVKSDKNGHRPIARVALSVEAIREGSNNGVRKRSPSIKA